MKSATNLAYRVATKYRAVCRPAQSGLSPSAIDFVSHRHRFALVAASARIVVDAEALLQQADSRPASLRAAWRRARRAVRRAAVQFRWLRLRSRAQSPRCCWPPESCVTGRFAICGKLDQLQQFGDAARLARSFCVLAQLERIRDVLRHRHMQETAASDRNTMPKSRWLAGRCACRGRQN